MTHEEFKKIFDEIQELGWKYVIPGAEGPYFDYKDFRLQFIAQTEDENMKSVINHNHQINGLQNIHIFAKKTFFTIFFGYIDTIEEFKILSNFLGIKYKQDEIHSRTNRISEKISES